MAFAATPPGCNTRARANISAKTTPDPTVYATRYSALAISAKGRCDSDLKMSAGSAKRMTKEPRARMSAGVVTPSQVEAKPSEIRMKIGSVIEMTSSIGRYQYFSRDNWRSSSGLLLPKPKNSR